jgi:predicted secreted protein
MAVHTLTETDNHSAVSVSVGDRLVLRLGESAGGGYTWKLVTLDRARLEVRGHDYRADPAIGSASEAVVTFEAIATGRTHVALRKVRPWQSRNDDQRFEFDVDIRA